MPIPPAPVAIACGSSDHAASYAAGLLAARLASLSTSLVMLHRAPLRAENLFGVAVAQSG
jgi:fructoselysine-6-P-deglycase FrlB-like protein